MKWYDVIEYQTGIISNTSHPHFWDMVELGIAISMSTYGWYLIIGISETMI